MFYFEGVGAPHFNSLNVTEPDFFKNMQELIGAHSLDDWKTYLRWHAVHASAAMLPTAFVNENFDFYSKTLTGTKELRPRWSAAWVPRTRRSARWSVRSMSIRPSARKQRAHAGHGWEHLRKKRSVRTSRACLDGRRHQSAGAGEAEGHLEPDRLYRQVARLFGASDRTRGCFRQFAARESNDMQRRLDKIGKPLDKREWPYPPMTINATYDPTQNNVTFPAGILQPPFYDNKADDALNFGAIGAVIGHELTHGFDDEGSQFDAEGNLRDWWSASDKKQFEERTSCIKDEYANFVAVDDVKLNGKLTLGENTADNGGLRIAYMALLNTFAGKEPVPIDGLTAEQRFFLDGPTPGAGTAPTPSSACWQRSIRTHRTGIE